MIKYKRILLKLSGESLAGEAGFGIDGAEHCDCGGVVFAGHLHFAGG